MSGEAPLPQEALEGILAELADVRQKVRGLETAGERDRGLIADLSTSLRELAGQPDQTPGERGGYCSVAAPLWWQLDGDQRATQITRLRSWVGTVFRPGYGHLAARVGPCWEQHDLCLYQLAWLSEIHTVIYQAPERALSAEADWHVRLLPAAVALMAEETGSCDHLHQPRSGPVSLAVRA